MITSIFISGQVHGNSILRSAICSDYRRETMFYGYELIFPTKKEAKKALWEAYKYLRSDKEDARASQLSYRKGAAINYDASKAVIEPSSESGIKMYKECK